MSEIGENLRGMSEMWFVAVPDHVVVLTFGDSHNAYTFLVDTKFGVVHVCDSYLPSWGVNEHAPENEEWRIHSQRGQFQTFSNF